MKGKRIDLDCVRNTDFQLVMVIFEDDTNVVIDLSAYTLDMEVQRGSDAPILSTQSTPATITSTLTASGVVTISITDEVTRDLVSGEYDYNMTLIDGSGFKEAFFYGNFNVISSTLQS